MLQFLGLGDNVVDQYMDTEMQYPGGQALNFAAYARMLGIQSAYLGVFGNDKNAIFVRSVAEKLQISLLHCPTRIGENGYACVTHQKGERLFLHSNKGGVAGEQPLVLGAQELDYIQQFSLVHTSANGRMDHELVKLAAQNSVVSYDFSVRFAAEKLQEICPHITFAVLSCSHLSVVELHSAIAQAHQYGAAHVLATRGEEGSYFSNGQSCWFCKANAVAAIDTLGAGDSYLTAFMAAFIPFYQQAKGQSPPAADYEQAVIGAMEKASAFAATIVQMHGAFGFGRALKVDPTSPEPN